MEIKLIRCPHCGAKNRVPVDRLRQNPICGRCRKPLNLSSVTEHPLEITDETFAKLIMQYPGAALVMFYSPACPYCRKLMPIVDRLAPEYAGRARIAKIDIDRNKTIASQLSVNAVPTMVFVKKGTIVNRLAGVLPKKDLEDALDSLL